MYKTYHFGQKLETLLTAINVAVLFFGVPGLAFWQALKMIESVPESLYVPLAFLIAIGIALFYVPIYLKHFSYLPERIIRVIYSRQIREHEELMEKKFGEDAPHLRAKRYFDSLQKIEDEHASNTRIAKFLRLIGW